MDLKKLISLLYWQHERHVHVREFLTSLVFEIPFSKEFKQKCRKYFGIDSFELWVDVFKVFEGEVFFTARVKKPPLTVDVLNFPENSILSAKFIDYLLKKDPSLSEASDSSPEGAVVKLLSKLHEPISSFLEAQEGF